MSRPVRIPVSDLPTDNVIRGSGEARGGTFANNPGFREAAGGRPRFRADTSNSIKVLQHVLRNGYYGGDPLARPPAPRKYYPSGPEVRALPEKALASCGIGSATPSRNARPCRRTSESVMIPRKRLDIGWRDLFFGMGQCLSGDNRAKGHAACRENTGNPDEALFFLSLRSGFDAVLQAARFPRGSHVLVSAITIPDILEIIRSHGLVPVPVDLDPQTLEPDPDSLNSGLTPRAVALLATHLFGARIPMDPLVRFARKHGLVLFEDCAQAYCGDGFTGHPESHVRMFSFGPIKYYTALGGGLLFVRDPDLRDEVRRLHHSYPVQGKARFFLRLAKYGVVLLLNRPGPYTLLCAACRLLGMSHDAVSYRATRGFRGLELLKKIRRQPCGALLHLLSRRLRSNAQERTGCRKEVIAFHRSVPELCYPGRRADHSYWLFVVRVGNAADLCRQLWDAGFDAHLWPPSLCVVPPDRNLPGQAPTFVRALWPQLLFLPVYPLVGRVRAGRLSRIVGKWVRMHG